MRIAAHDDDVLFDLDLDGQHVALTRDQASRLVRGGHIARGDVIVRFRVIGHLPAVVNELQGMEVKFVVPR